MTSCPRCLHPLQAEKVRSATILGCATCGGVWLEAAQTNLVFRRLPGGEAIIGASEQTAQASGKAQPHTDGVAKCPICRRDMVRVEAEEIVIDQCPPHGTWFDPHELRDIVSRADRDAEPNEAGSRPVLGLGPDSTRKTSWWKWEWEWKGLPPSPSSDDKPDAGDWVEAFLDALFAVKRSGRG